MLIIAVPKSASSALIATLGAAHGLPNGTERVRRGEIRKCSIADGFRELERFHRHEVAEVSDAVAAAVATRGELVKLHFPPTANNQAKLASTPKVILLREPEEVIRAYQRGDETGAFKLRHPRFCFCLSERAWMQRAIETGVLDELRAFVVGWKAHEGDKLVVESRELTRDPKNAIARIEAYFGLPPSGQSELSQVRFTRGATRRRTTPHILFARRRIIGQRISQELRCAFTRATRDRSMDSASRSRG